MDPVPFNVLSRAEREQALKRAEALKAGMAPDALDALIDEYVRGGKEALERITYLTPADRRRIENGLRLEQEKEAISP